MKTNYIIGIDLDSTLIETNAAVFAARSLGYELNNKDVCSWDHNNFPEDMRSKMFEYFEDEVHMCDNSVPIEGAQEKIKKWHADGHKIVLITARVESIRPKTIEMVNRLFPEISDINFVGMDQSKKDVMLEKNIDFWIDDAPHGVLDSISLGINTFLVSNNYTKYNWHVKDNESLKGIVKIIADIDL